MLDLMEWWFDDFVELESLGKVSKRQFDFEVSMLTSISGESFSIQGINLERASIFEIYLQFELGQIRYLAGGDEVYIDRYLSADSSNWLMKLKHSAQPIGKSKSNSLASVYHDVYLCIQGFPNQLPTGEVAGSLVTRMKSFLERE
jgi:hypothetical protein